MIFTGKLWRDTRRLVEGGESTARQQAPMERKPPKRGAGAGQRANGGEAKLASKFSLSVSLTDPFQRAIRHGWSDSRPRVTQRTA